MTSCGTYSEEVQCIWERFLASEDGMKGAPGDSGLWGQNPELNRPQGRFRMPSPGLSQRTWSALLTTHLKIVRSFRYLQIWWSVARLILSSPVSLTPFLFLFWEDSGRDMPKFHKESLWKGSGRVLRHESLGSASFGLCLVAFTFYRLQGLCLS